MKSALVDGAIAEEAERDARVFLVVDDLIHVFGGECEASAEGDLCSDDAVSAKHVVSFVEHVHGAAFAFCATADPAVHFSHAVFGFHASSEGVSVIAVCGDDGVIVFGGGGAADSDGFLADVYVAEASDLSVLVCLHASDFELANQEHVSQPLGAFLDGQFGSERFFIVGCRRGRCGHT